MTTLPATSTGRTIHLHAMTWHRTNYPPHHLSLPTQPGRRATTTAMMHVVEQPCGPPSPSGVHGELPSNGRKGGAASHVLAIAALPLSARPLTRLTRRHTPPLRDGCTARCWRSWWRQATMAATAPDPSCNFIAILLRQGGRLPTPVSKHRVARVSHLALQ